MLSLYTSSLALLLAAVADAGYAFPRATAGDGFLHLPVKKSSGLPIRINKRAGKAIEAQLTNYLEVYTVEVEIGTPPQRTFVSIDTGSSELWVNPNCSSVAEAFGQRAICEAAPVVNISESSSAQGPGAVETITYGSLGEVLTGVVLDMYLDTVRIGDAKVTSQRLGIPEQARGLSAGIMGLAPSFDGWAINKTYPLLLDNLSLQKVINSRAYSIALGAMNNSTGSLLFGGIDTKKFSGKLVPLPIVDSVDGKPRLTIDYKSLTLASTNGTKSFDVQSTNVVVDSGNTFTKLQADLVQEVWDTVGARLDESLGFPVIDCSARKQAGRFTFGFEGVNVTVSFADMIYEADGICLFGIVKTVGDSQQVLGDTFMRSAYTVFDLDNKNIHLAQYTNCGSAITAIGSGEGAVPSVMGSCGTASSSQPTSTGASSTASQSATSASASASSTITHSSSGGTPLKGSRSAAAAGVMGAVFMIANIAGI